MPSSRKPAIWLHGEVRSPPFTAIGRREAGAQLARVQDGERIEFPTSRPMPSIGPRCHELRIRDAGHNWRIVYRTDPDAILVVDVFPKTTERTPDRVIARCQRRLSIYDAAADRIGGS